MRRQLSRAGRADPLHYSGLLCGAGSALLASLIATPPVLCVSASRVRPRQNQHDIAIAEGRAHYAEVGLPRAHDDRDADGKARASERRRRRRHTPFVRVPLVSPRRRALPCWHSTRLQGLEIGTSVQVVYVRPRPSAQCLCYCPRNGNSSPTGSRTEDGRARRRRRRRRGPRPDLDGRPDRATGRMIRPLCLGAPTGLTTRDVSFYLFFFPLPGEPGPSQ